MYMYLQCNEHVESFYQITEPGGGLMTPDKGTLKLSENL